MAVAKTTDTQCNDSNMQCAGLAAWYQKDLYSAWVFTTVGFAI